MRESEREGTWAVPRSAACADVRGRARACAGVRARACAGVRGRARAGRRQVPEGMGVGATLGLPIASSAQ